jgi:nitrogen-specific signal transduction histidine kinase
MSKFLVAISLLSTENMTKNFSTVFNLLANHICEHPQIENFISIGEICFSQDGQDYFYEVNCRLNKTEQNEETELLFNDITRTKIREKENAEYKYKSLYFSKVIHEFKNPLICICELVNQTQDIISFSKVNNRHLISNIEEINSLANFLQILIKDFTHLTESQYQKTTDFEKKETDLYSVVDFCNRIGKTLLKKYNKSEKVEYKFNIDKNVPDKIITDEWKLKQTIINLLSNSIKFTLSGSITLDLSLDEQINPTRLDKNFYEDKSFVESNRVKFLVKDTGIGMSEELFKDLSKPFKKQYSNNNKKCNEFGSGLGLSIANEMTSKLGYGLECETKLGEGTSFWFYIPFKNDALRENTHEPVLIIESNSCEEEDIFNDKKLNFDLRTDQSNCLLSHKSFATRELKDLYLQKPIGIYTDYIESSLDEVMDSIILNSQRSNKSISMEKEKENSIYFKVKF